MKNIKSLSELKGYLLRLNETEDPSYMRERERQMSMYDKLNGGKATGENYQIEEEDDKSSGASKTLDDDKASLKSGNITVDKIIDKLNTIRSGKSFKDSAIKSSLEEYVNSLKKPEKVALFAFLKGVAQIVTGEIVGDKALEPSDPDPAVKMEKGKYKKVIKPTIVKKSEKKSSEEETSTPVPIRPKK